MKMAESSHKGYKTLREKEKLLIMSNFSFSHSVFKKLVLQTRKNQGLFGKGLMHKSFTEILDLRGKLVVVVVEDVVVVDVVVVDEVVVVEMVDEVDDDLVDSVVDDDDADGAFVVAVGPGTSGFVAEMKI